MRLVLDRRPADPPRLTEAADDDALVLRPLPEPPSAPVDTPLGPAVVLVGDDCVDPLALAGAARFAPVVLVLQFDPESDLQAEAAIEYAASASLSVAPLVVAVTPEGLEPACVIIAQGGDLLAEGLTGDLQAEAHVDPLLRLPRTRPPLADPPPILAQRVAAHHGRKAPVSWLADLS